MEIGKNYTKNFQKLTIESVFLLKVRDLIEFARSFKVFSFNLKMEWFIFSKKLNCVI